MGSFLTSFQGVQYADDTMILIQNDDLAIANLKFLLICFELLSGLKINYHKSEVIVMGVAVEEQARVACLLNCQEGVFPFRYLGFPMSNKRLIIADLEPLVVVWKRTEPWQVRFMSSAASVHGCLPFQPATLHDGLVPGTAPKILPLYQTKKE
jgi:hypothetical protein